MKMKRMRIEGDAALMREVEKYYAAHPFGPAALRHPRIVLDDGRYVAYAGRSIKDGVIGFGTSISSALHAFDDLYVRSGSARTG